MEQRAKGVPSADMESLRSETRSGFLNRHGGDCPNPGFCLTIDHDNFGCGNSRGPRNGGAAGSASASCRGFLGDNWSIINFRLCNLVVLLEAV